MNVAAYFSAAIALIGALPGAVAAMKGIYDDIKGHDALTPAEKVSLLAQTKLDVDAEDDKVQAVDVPNPKPTV